MKYILCLLTLVNLITAYGLFISNDYGLAVGRAVVMLEQDGGFEDLSLFVAVCNINIYGSDSFAWVMPLPSMPAYGDADSAAFDGMTRISAPIDWYYSHGGCSGSAPDYIGVGDDYCEVLNRNILDPISRDTVRAESLTVITHWLNDHGYLITAEVRTALGECIENDRKCFCVSLYPPVPYDARVGLKMRYTDSVMSIPMKISRLNTDYGYWPHSYWFYSIGHHKKTHALAELLYANSLTQSEIEAITTDYPGLLSCFEPGDYLTKLEITYDQQDMEDITLTDAPDDQEYRRLCTDSVFGGFSDPFMIMFILLFMYKRVIRKAPKKKPVSI